MLGMDRVACVNVYGDNRKELGSCVRELDG